MSAGSIKKAPNRTWYFVVDVRAANGARKQLRRRGFRTKKEATTALAIIVADESRGTFVRPTKGLTVRKFLVDEWLPTRIAKLKPGTAEAYRKCIEYYVLPHIGDVKLADVDIVAINQLYSKLLTSGRTGGSWRKGGLAPKTVRNVAGVLHAAFRDAVAWRRISHNPCDSAVQPRKDAPEMNVWTTTQIQTFMRFVADDRHHGIWHLLFTTGMRRGELIGLRWADIDLDRGHLSIRRSVGDVDGVLITGTTKTMDSTRRLGLDPGTVAALREWKAIQSADRLLMGEGWLNSIDALVTEPDGRPTSPQSMSKRFKALAAAAALPVIRFHDIRHTYATAALLAGVPVKVVSQRLGHSDVRITLMIYAHVMPGDDQDAAEVAAAAIMGSSTARDGWANRQSKIS